MSSTRANTRRRPALAVVRATAAALLRLPRVAGLLLAAGWMAAIAWLSSGPAPVSPKVPWGHYVANLGHAPLFGLLALWWVVALPRRERGGDAPRWARLGPAAGAGVVAAVALYGWVDERRQLAVPGRESSPFDLLTDAVAAAAVVVVAAYAGRADATERGLLARLGGGFLACLAAAALSTWPPA